MKEGLEIEEVLGESGIGQKDCKFNVDTTASLNSVEKTVVMNPLFSFSSPVSLNKSTINVNIPCSRI